MNVENNREQEDYWAQRYKEERTGWDIGAPSIPIQSYVDQLKDKTINILIPGAGNAYEAEYLFNKGFTNVFILDIAAAPLDAFSKRMPAFPKKQIIQSNFFEHNGQYDLIIEQTFFCSFPPTIANRSLYAKKMHELLSENGKLVGVWFDIPLKGDMEKRPFGGTAEEYLSYLNPYFDTTIFERSKNSIPPRAGTELFGIFVKTKGSV